jgi:hypothetical protein
LKVGQVWAYRTTIASGGVVLITRSAGAALAKETGDDFYLNHAQCKVLAGADVRFIGPDSVAARCAVLVQGVWQMEPTPPSVLYATSTSQSTSEMKPVKAAPERADDEDSNPRWLQVINRILLKAERHAKAGRARQFSQVFVPKDDYKALLDHFGNAVGNALFPNVEVFTAIGPISVHPVNPDGATFSD